MQVCFKLQVCEGIGTSSSDRMFSRVIELPFVPPVGMEVCEGDWSATVESLCYANGMVFAFVEVDRATKRREKDEMNAIAAYYEDAGWDRSDGILSV